MTAFTALTVGATGASTTRKVLGEFGKGIKGSSTLNFGNSGGKHCDTGCPHHPSSGGHCYAVRAEIRPDRADLVKKLQRHEAADPADLILKAIDEIKARRNPAPWLRVSAFGSVPNPEHVTLKFVRAMRTLLRLCNEKGIPVHFPVETAAKADFYRKKFGDLVVIRESAKDLHEFLSTSTPVSFVVGRRKQTTIDRLSSAKLVAKMRTERTGRKTIVCPAVAATFAQYHTHVPNLKAKCGNCTACAQKHVDVIYPLH